MSVTSADDNLIFAPESEPEHRQPVPDGWRVLIVDDDPDVHSSTEFALRGKQILGRPLVFLHAFSAAETLTLLDREQDIAAILLDVVMESDTAGLALVRTLREERRLTEPRIILRTGQPGFAPELQVIRDYDINDYKTKSELTQTRLYTALTAAIRAYAHIRELATGRRGLKLIARASSHLMEHRELRSFAAVVIRHIAALLDTAPNGLLFAHTPGQPPTVVAAAGQHAASINCSLDALHPPRLRQLIAARLANGDSHFNTHELSLGLTTRDGQRLAVFLETTHPVSAFNQQLLQAFSANIAVGFANTQLFAQLHSQAYFDPLTALPNRLRFLHAIDARMLGGQTDATVALVDIDAFAETNDALGHHFGDHLLQSVAERLREFFPNAVLARVAGDAFGILDERCNVSPSNLAVVFSQPFRVDDQELVITATQGFVNLSEINGKGVDVLRSANMALKRAKQRNRGEHSYFTREMATETSERVALLNALRAAFDAERLFLMYQPLIALDNRRAVGVEALIRWRGNDGQLIPPDRFIPLAEHTGLIIAIGQRVLVTACREQVALAQAGFGHLRIAVNVSQVQFRHPEFVQHVRDALLETGADPTRIELEITESMAMEDAVFVSETLKQLAALGLGIAIDDFGTGFSSLACLRQFQVDRLKIDRSFIRNVCASERDRQIPEMVIQLSQRLGLSVVAEGVEEAAQADYLAAQGCPEAQGFLFARPMEAAQLLDWLRAQPT